MVNAGGGVEKTKVTILIEKDNDDWIRQIEQRLGGRAYSVIVNRILARCRECQKTCDKPLINL